MNTITLDSTGQHWTASPGFADEKDWIFFTCESSGQSQMVWILFGAIISPEGARQYPRYSMDSEWNSHFLGLAYKLYFCRW